MRSTTARLATSQVAGDAQTAEWEQPCPESASGATYAEVDWVCGTSRSRLTLHGSQLQNNALTVKFKIE